MANIRGHRFGPFAADVWREWGADERWTMVTMSIAVRGWEWSVSFQLARPA